jgi:hypothetical protein
VYFVLKQSAMSTTETERPSGPRIYSPWSDEAFCRFSVPEFIGTSGDQRFIVSQQVDWVMDPSGPGRLSCALNTAPENVGYDFRASLSSARKDEIRFDLAMTNYESQPFHDGHHTVLLDLSGMEGFDDPTGENTLVYSEAGWITAARILESGGIDSLREAIRPGCNYAKNTVLWDIMVRRDRERKHSVAFMMKKGYAFCGDHPDWGPSILIGCRWTELPPKEKHTMTGWIFFGGPKLVEMENRYDKARRTR